MPGTSNSLYGQVKCAKCPVGTLCPEYGMQTPVLCPAGYVCDRDGLAVWSRQCPPGYYCLEGTVTANATSLLKPKPIQCGVGTYCLIGSYTNKTKIGDLGTAQPCAEGTYCWEATGSQQGTAPCPKGSYCPAGSASPVPAAPGTLNAVQMPDFSNVNVYSFSIGLQDSTRSVWGWYSTPHVFQEHTRPYTEQCSVFHARAALSVGSTAW